MRTGLVLALGLALACAGRNDGVPMTAHDGTLVPPPHDLESAMAALDRVLSPEDIATMRTPPPDGDTASYHFGIGGALRNNWGLWQRSPLARWFHARGIVHADDMSSIIISSYIRRLRGEPIRLEEQIASHREAWDEIRASARAEVAEGPKRAARIEAARMGWTFADRKVPVVPFPRENTAPLDLIPWRLEPYRDGVLVLVEPDYPEREQPRPIWHAGVLWLEPGGATLRPVQRGDCPAIHDVLTLGTDTHWLCRDADTWTIVHETAAGAATREVLAIDSAWLRLGSAKHELLVLDARRLHRRRAGSWSVAHERSEDWMTPDATPPRLDGKYLYFITDDPIYGSDDLIRVDTTTSEFPESGRDLLLVPHYGNWSSQCDAIVPRKAGGLWVTAGHRFFATLMHVEPDRTRIAVFDGSVDRRVKFDDGLLVHPRLNERQFRRQIPATAVAEVGDAVFLAGDLGIAVSRAGRVEPVVRFAVDRSELVIDAASESFGPRMLAVLPPRGGGPPSFVVATSRLAVVRAEGAGYVLAWPRMGAATSLE